MVHARAQPKLNERIGLADVRRREAQCSHFDAVASQPSGATCLAAGGSMEALEREGKRKRIRVVVGGRWGRDNDTPQAF